MHLQLIKQLLWRSAFRKQCYSFRPCERCAFVLIKEQTLLPDNKTIKPLLSFTCSSGLLHMKIDAINTPVYLRNMKLDDCPQLRINRCHMILRFCHTGNRRSIYRNIIKTLNHISVPFVLAYQHSFSSEKQHNPKIKSCYCWCGQIPLLENQWLNIVLYQIRLLSATQLWQILFPSFHLSSEPQLCYSQLHAT